jgi:protein TonB
MVGLDMQESAPARESVPVLPVELQPLVLPVVVQPAPVFPFEAASITVNATRAPATAIPSDASTSGTAPRLVQHVDYLEPLQLTYPRPAKRRRAQGMVLVHVFIDSEGRPRVVNLYRSSGDSDLDREALRAVRKARFRPPSVNGVPESVQVLVPVNFFLTGPT